MKRHYDKRQHDPKIAKPKAYRCGVPEDKSFEGKGNVNRLVELDDKKIDYERPIEKGRKNVSKGHEEIPQPSFAKRSKHKNPSLVKIVEHAQKLSPEEVSTRNTYETKASIEELKE